MINLVFQFLFEVGHAVLKPLVLCSALLQQSAKLRDFIRVFASLFYSINLRRQSLRLSLNVCYLLLNVELLLLNFTLELGINLVVL